MDAPQPPGGPLRQDVADGPVTPGGPGTPAQPGEPEQVDPPDREPTVQPSSDPDGPATIPAPATPEGEPGPDEQVADAQTSQGEPSVAAASE